MPHLLVTNDFPPKIGGIQSYLWELWRRLDPVLWDLTQNPWAILRTVSPQKLQSLLADASFRGKVDALIGEKRRSSEATAGIGKSSRTFGECATAGFSTSFTVVVTFTPLPELACCASTRSISTLTSSFLETAQFARIYQCFRGFSVRG